MAFAAIRLLAPLRTTDESDLKEQEKKMLTVFRVPADCKNPKVKERGDGIVITWLKGTWIQGDDYSYIEERRVCQSPFLAFTKFTKVMLNGKELDINNLPDLPASALKKMEKHFNDGRWINLITTPRADSIRREGQHQSRTDHPAHRHAAATATRNNIMFLQFITSFTNV